jgi:DNA-binding MarR family transcriptional regulator
MFRSKLELGLFVFAFAILLPQFGILTFGQNGLQVARSNNLETKVLIDSKGSIHILWTVPSSNSSGSTPGIWYSKYDPNGTGAVPPTLIRNSSLVQAADMALDKFDTPHIVWAEGLASANSSAALGAAVNSRLYYGEVNSTDPRNFVPTALTAADKVVMWPSLAVDDALTSHLVWTQLDVREDPAGGAYYGRLGTQKLLNQTTRIASYNRTLKLVPRPRLAFDRISDDLHMAWVESNVIEGGQVVSDVRYAQVDLRTGNITRLRVAVLNEPTEDASVVSGSTGDAYVVWQQNVSGNAGTVNVAQISASGRVTFVRELAPPSAQEPAPRFAVSADSQDNLYVIWYQPYGIPSQLPSQSNTAPASISYLKLDRDGSLWASGSELVTGPLIAVTVSQSGDVFAISQQGIVRVASPINTLSIGLITAAAIVSSAMAGAATTEEVRYRMLRSLAPITKSLNHKRAKDGPRKDYGLLRAISRRPGLGIRELKDLLPRERPTISKLALLERDGYVSSIRTGLRRRFYTMRNLSSPDESFAISINETIPSRILREIESIPGIWEAKLADNLGLSQQIVHYHLKKLQTLKILTSESKEKRKHYWLRGSAQRKGNARLSL